ncbi:MAG: TIGR00159 family protein [Chloroflexi bacterium]|nr:TIGR00159 family protein [Chloroflexota bacterium]
MNEFTDNLGRMIQALNPFISGFGAWFDVFAVTLIIYLIWRSIEGSRAPRLVLGIVIIVVVYVISEVLQLTMVGWIISNIVQPAVVVAIPVVFQSELRRLLESLGRPEYIEQITRLRFWERQGNAIDAGRLAVIQTVARTAATLSQQGTGALIVFENKHSLQDYIDGGVKLDAEVSQPLLATIFYPSTPLHDMAVVIRGTRVIAANVMLPISEDMTSVRRYGTRHRAARGLTERTDAVVLVVSEETGTISLAYDGMLNSQLNEQRIVEEVSALLMNAGKRAPQKSGASV